MPSGLDFEGASGSIYFVQLFVSTASSRSLASVKVEQVEKKNCYSEVESLVSFSVSQLL